MNLLFVCQVVKSKLSTNHKLVEIRELSEILLVPANSAIIKVET
jgi:hypothetical protein